MHISMKQVKNTSSDSASGTNWLSMHLASETVQADWVWSRAQVQSDASDELITNSVLQTANVVVHCARMWKSVDPTGTRTQMTSNLGEMLYH